MIVGAIFCLFSITIPNNACTASCSVSEGQNAVVVNGQIENIFRNKHGLRQCNLLWPLLFNLVADALLDMLEKAIAAGHIKGVVAYLISGA